MEYAALQILGLKPRSDNEKSEIAIIRIIQNGLSKRNLLKIKSLTGFSYATLARILSISTKTIESYQPEDKFSDTASERLFKLAEVLAFGKKVFGDEEILNDWLNRPLRPLDGQRPIDVMVNFYGLELVKNLLGRIENSVYS
jgi:putative toxin-antitoxin system antitoxin component (TIGR02293 family)